MKKAIWIVAAGLMAVSLACSAFGTPTPPEATAEGGITATPTTQPPGEASPTPAPAVTTEAGCTLNGAFVADVTVPDNTEFPPGTAFTKTWRLRNTGTCTWEAGTLLVFVSGDAMDGPASAPVGVVAPGATVDVSVDLVAPASPGTYKGNWQLQTPDGTLFGAVVYVQIVVPEPTEEATETPTEAPTEEPTEEPTAAPCVVVDPELKPILDHMLDQGLDPGCPTAEASTVYGAFQEFWANVDNPDPHLHFRSLAIWRSDNREIYFIVGEDTDASQGNILAYTDFWDESQPEVHPDCEGMTVPDGYQLPVRGFGKVWCENELWDVVGWPSVPETGVTLRIQPVEMGLLIKVSGAIPIWYLVGMHYPAVRAVTLMTAP